MAQTLKSTRTILIRSDFMEDKDIIMTEEMEKELTNGKGDDDNEEA